ncbi:alpha/beta hydrolase [Pseudonocardia nantongensis]|uniref:alpha/beta hydrolase n=1 Tax=Pseudonocardia nantongensis TaxID=1181885 RepID=UPI00397CB3A8
MPTVAELAAADPAALLHRARDWEALSGALAGCAATLDRSNAGPPPGWQGADADAARDAHDRLRARVTAAAASAARISEVLGRHAGATLDAQRRLLEAVVTVHPGATRVDLTTGAISAVPGLPAVPDPITGLGALIADLLRFRDAACAALADATRADAEAAAALRGLAPDGPGPPAPPEPPAAPADVRRWWSELSPPQRDVLVGTDPARIGTLVGVPAADRDRANRLRLDAEQAWLGAVRRSLHTDPAGAARTEAALAGLAAVRRRLDAGGAYLLDLDAGSAGSAGASGGRVVLAVGDPDRAAHVVTHVPGTGAGWASAAEDLRRTEATRDAARATGAGEVAAILWTGYDAPPTLAAAAFDRAARDAAGDLRAFQDGVRAGHEGPVHLTVVGHSYGTTVTGHAARGGQLAADDVVLVGSPGAGVRAAADLGLPPGRVWATTAAHDPIDRIPGPELFGTSRGFAAQGLAHGIDPASPAFGARVFASAPGSALPGPDDPATPSDESALAAAHSQYWEPHSPSLATLGRIVAGTTGRP